MFQQKSINNLNEYFQPLKNRGGNFAYFYRINGYNDVIKDFTMEYYNEARKCGVIIEGKIQNPTDKNLEYFREMMGDNFNHSVGFITGSLKKWLPRLNNYQLNAVATAMYDTLDLMKKEGKNDNILKNGYIKFMCWLYYRFERIVIYLGNETVPKILYEGTLTAYELKILEILNKTGCDIVLLQTSGDSGYLSLDKTSKISAEYKEAGMVPFPQGFGIKGIQKAIEEEMQKERLYGIKPNILNCTNAWIEGKGIEDITKEISLRGNDPKLFYNCLIRINGVWDRLTYENDLYQLYIKLTASKRKVVVVEGNISSPTPEEVEKIVRNNYDKLDHMVLHLSKNIKFSENVELERLMVKSFVDCFIDEEHDGNINKLANTAVYILCWLKRYEKQLFSGWKMPMVSNFIFLGCCTNHNETMFLKFLSKLPVDVLILNSNLNVKCMLDYKMLYEINYEQSLNVTKFPVENDYVRVGTAAYHAERDLDQFMYQDTGIYRDYQYQRSNSIVLKTMYEEIFILWEEHIKYRSSFSVVENVVTVPTIFCKVCGVKNSDLPKYWASIEKLLVDDVFFIKTAPCITHGNNENNFFRSKNLFKDGKVLKNKIKEDKSYKYSFLRDDKQEMILDKIQQLIDLKIIKGTGENGMENAIISTILNLNLAIVRMIQRFDSTKKNPKIVYLNTTETMASLEDSIMVAFLNLIGFDIVFFIPTGYQNVEIYYNKKIMEEHIIGDYMYDLAVPKFNRLPSSKVKTWTEKLFKRR
ncbi:MAG: YceG family protein [Anaerotignaceae bacterium]